MQGDRVSSEEYCREITEKTFEKVGCGQTTGDHEVQHKGSLQVSEWVGARTYTVSCERAEGEGYGRQGPGGRQLDLHGG